MKIVAAYKWAANPQEATVGNDGSVNWGRAQNSISEYDPVAIEAGAQLAAATGGELVGLSVGGSDAASALAKKGVLSRGPDRLVLMADDSLARLDSVRTAQLLAEGVQQIGDVDVVVCGASSIDVSAGLVPAALAGVLGWPCVLEVSKVEADADALRVERHGEFGTEVLRVATPAVIGMTADALTPRIPGMKDILGAGKKPSETLPATAPEPGFELVEARKPALKQRKKVIINGDDPAAAAAQVVSALRTDGVL